MHITGEKRERAPKLTISLNSDLRNTLHNLASCKTLRECLGEIFDNVIDVLDPDRDTDEIICDSTGELLCFRELFMGGRGGVDDQGPVYGSAGARESTDLWIELTWRPQRWQD